MCVAALSVGAAACTPGAPEAESPTPSGPKQTPYAEVPLPELFVDPEGHPDSGPSPLRVQFSVEVEDFFGPFECKWNFGDGSPVAEGLAPIHVFEKTADYEVVVVCEDSEGIVGEGECDVFVEGE